MHNTIEVKGARVHNLQNISLSFPKGRVVVFTGPSGSGKSSLAFDTLFAEGQRRYIESLSVYARQFLGDADKPDVDEIRGLSPTVSIEQKSVVHNPRSTVGTITEVYDYLRVFWARVGLQHCHQCNGRVGGGSAAEIIRALQQVPERCRYSVLAPLVRNRKGEFKDLFTTLRKQGFVRIRLDGEWTELAELVKVDKNTRHTIEVVIDRLVGGIAADRVSSAVTAGLAVGDGSLLVVAHDPSAGFTERLYSSSNVCRTCDIAYPAVTQQSFSFNSPLGRCPTCFGLGEQQTPDERAIVPDPDLSIAKGCLAPLEKRATKESRALLKTLLLFCDLAEVPRKVPWRELTPEQRRTVLEGSPHRLKYTHPKRGTAATVSWPGVHSILEEWWRESESEHIREWLRGYFRPSACSGCGGSRLRPESRGVQVQGTSIADVVTWDIQLAADWSQTVILEGTDLVVGSELLREIQSRLGFLVEIGLGYLTLGRSGPTLSGGEAQRIRLATQLGSELSGVLYVLDEPSIGLHQRDNDKLLELLQSLRKRNNSIIVVEHDRDTIERADWVVDFGPGAGTAGGHVVFNGPPGHLRDMVGNVTGDYLSGRRSIDVPGERRSPGRGEIRITGATANNLQGVDASFPIGAFTCVTGVSGAGKSTLVNEILLPAALNAVNGSEHEVGSHASIRGLESLNKVIEIDQQPIGRTPRSNPATYTKLFDEIRSLFAQLPEAKIYGYEPGRFSFNVAGGRCEACHGAGLQKIELSFLSDTYVTCETCRGRRFNDATLRVKYRGRSIADVLDMPIEEATELFAAYPRIKRYVDALLDVGLGYMKVGQPSTTLSGGEAQRVKLARELAKPPSGDTLYILDEPSTGLHFDDVRKLLVVVQRLVTLGNTVVMIEHNLDIIKTADWVVDIGPEGGRHGGRLVAMGAPESVAAVSTSHTGRYLAPLVGTPTPAAATPGPAAGEGARRGRARKPRGSSSG
jgi:excinuclease ABC subunit A